MNELERQPRPHAEGEHFGHRPSEHRPSGHRQSGDQSGHEQPGHRQPPPRSESDRGNNPGVLGSRVRRDELDYIVLDMLRDQPKLGYEVIQAIALRSVGQYVPSPGGIYPTLQYLEELGFLQADLTGNRRIYGLTDAGRTELDAHAEAVVAFWTRWDSPIASVASPPDYRT